MAKKTQPKGADSSAALAPDEGTVTPRIKLGETGFSALKTRAGKMYEEANVQFRYPNMLRVVAEMKNSPPVAIGLSTLNTLMNRADVTVLPIVGETATDKARREYLLSVLHDMDDSFQTTMQSISSFKEYGHQVSEIVLRRRLNVNGSKFNDGLVGLRALKNRPQNSIYRWKWSDDGRTLEGLEQSIANMENSYRYTNQLNQNGLIDIPREKFLLFRADPADDNPEGNSILKAAYLAYKQLSLISDQLMTGIAKDVSGVPYAQIPPIYMADDASADQKAVYAAVKEIVANISAGQQSGVVMPKTMDDKGSDLFSLELMEHKSGKAYDLPAIIKQLQANILYVLGCGSVSMSAADGGSLSLQDSDTNLLALSVAYRLSEIANTFNQELVPLLWKMNSWDTSRMPKIAFKDVSSVSIEEFTKGVQRLASTSTMEINRSNLNKICEVMGFEKQPDDAPVDSSILPAIMTGQQSSGGEGMAVGTTGKGTAKNGTDGGQNPSDNNANNKA